MVLLHLVHFDFDFILIFSKAKRLLGSLDEDFSSKSFHELINSSNSRKDYVKVSIVDFF